METWTWGCHNSTTGSFDYSRVGSKTDGSEPSVARGSVSRASSVFVRENWVSGARNESGFTESDLVAPSFVGKKWPDGSRTAPDGVCVGPSGAGGSELLLPDDSCDYSAFDVFAVPLI